MNLDDLQRKLIKAARANPLSEQVPLAFEKRIMAVLKGRQVIDEWAFWARALWRAAAPCLVIMILLAAWSFLSPTASTANAGSVSLDVAQDFENTVLAAADQEPAAESFR